MSPRAGDSQHTRDDAASYHAEPSTPAAEHVAPERRYWIGVRGTGWFQVTAEDDADAADVAEQLLSSGGNPVEEWLELTVESIHPEDD